MFFNVFSSLSERNIVALFLIADLIFATSITYLLCRAVDALKAEIKRQKRLTRIRKRIHARRKEEASDAYKRYAENITP